ncbi:hypothetical protein KBB27_04240 [Patescibacteria group bacterium]|nr:hypothetical protein [Patescibacteria group bacterium]
MKKSPGPASPALKTTLTPDAKSPVPAPDSVPAIPSGYQINSVGLLTLEGERPRPARVLEKSLVGVKFLVWMMTKEGGYETINAPWNQIRFQQSTPPDRGETALLRECVKRKCAAGECYELNMEDDAFYKLLLAYHAMLTPATIADDLSRHAFIGSKMFALNPTGWCANLSLTRVRLLCKAPNQKAAQGMVRWMMQCQDLSQKKHQRVLLEIWLTNARVLRKQHYKIGSVLGQNIGWGEIVLLLSRYADADTFAGWSDVWTCVAAEQLSRQTDVDKELDWKNELIAALRLQKVSHKRDEWLRFPSLDKLSRLWNLTPEGFLDKCGFLSPP